MTTRRLSGVAWAGLVLAFYYRRAWQLMLAGPASWDVHGFFNGGWRPPWPGAVEAAWRAASGILGAAAVLAAGWLLGAFVLRVLRCRPRHALDVFLFRLAAGLAALSYLSFLLAAFGWYRPFVIIPLVAALGFAGTVVAGMHSVAVWRWLIDSWTAETRRDAAMRWIVLAALGFGVVGTLAPEREYDALWYHLWLPRLWLERGEPVDVVSEYVSLYPLTWELLYGNALMLGGVVAAKLLHFSCLPLLAIATWRLARRFFERTSPWTPVAILVTAPTVLWESTTAYIDLAVALYVTLGLYALLNQLLGPKDRHAGWFRLAVVCLGLAPAIKHLGLVIVALAALGVGLHSLLAARHEIRHGTFHEQKIRPSTRPTLVRLLPDNGAWKAGLVLVAAALALALPWYLRAWAASGNPVFPELYAVFGARPPERWDAFSETGLAGFKARFGLGRSPVSLLLLPWTATQHGARFGGTFGPLFLMAAPWVLACVWRLKWEAIKDRADRALLWLLFLVLGFGAVWASPVSSLQLRFLIPLVPLMSVLAAVGLDPLLRGAGRGWILVALLTLNLPPFTPLHDADRDTRHAWLTHVIRDLPVGVVVGREAQDAFLRREVPTYGAWRHLGEDDHGTVLVLEVGGGDNLYATQRKVPADSALARGAWQAGPGAEAVVSRTLERLRVTHVLFDRKSLAMMAREGAVLASSAFRDERLSLEYEDPAALLYRVAPTRSSATQRSLRPH